MAKQAKIIFACLVLLGIGTGIGYYTAPYKVKIVEKIVAKEVRVVDKHIDTRTVQTTDSKGRTVIVTETTDRSKERSDRSETTDRTTEKRKEDKDWIATGYSTVDKNGEKEFGGGLQRRIIGNVYVGVFGSSRGAGGVGISIRF